jgi:hypothetical protein
MPTPIEGVLRGPLGGNIARQRDNREIELQQKKNLLLDLEAVDRAMALREKVESAPLNRKKRRLAEMEVGATTKDFPKIWEEKREAAALELTNARLETQEQKNEFVAEAAGNVTPENFKREMQSWKALGIDVSGFENMDYAQAAPHLERIRQTAINDLPMARQEKLMQEEQAFREKVAAIEQKYALQRRHTKAAIAKAGGGAKSDQLKPKATTINDVTIARQFITHHPSIMEQYPDLLEDEEKMIKLSIALADATNYANSFKVSSEEAREVFLKELIENGQIEQYKDTGDDGSIFNFLKGFKNVFSYSGFNKEAPAPMRSELPNTPEFLAGTTNQPPAIAPARVFTMDEL